jgi:hypothetical protein
MDAYSILTGVGRIYVAPLNTAPPTLGTTPSGTWRDLGDTQDGLDMDPSQKIELTRTDQRTGPVKAVRSEEALKFKTKLAENTLENLGDMMGATVLDTAPGVGTIGTRKINFYRGASVDEHAFLFVGYSPYLDGSAGYYVPRGYFDLDSIKYDKAKNAPIPITFEALEDLNASTADERFGYLIAKDALALP